MEATAIAQPHRRLQERDLAYLTRELRARVDTGGLARNWSSIAAAAVVEDAFTFARLQAKGDQAWAGRKLLGLDEIRFTRPMTGRADLDGTWRTSFRQLQETGGTFALAFHEARRIELTAPTANGLRRGLVRLASGSDLQSWPRQAQMDFFDSVSTAMHEAIHLATWRNGTNWILEEALAEEGALRLTPAFAKAEFGVTFPDDVIRAAEATAAYPKARANLRRLLELSGKSAPADALEAVRLLALGVPPAQRQEVIARWIARTHGVERATPQSFRRLRHEVDRTMLSGHAQPRWLRAQTSAYETASLTPRASMDQAIGQLEQRPVRVVPLTRRAPQANRTVAGPDTRGNAPRPVAPAPQPAPPPPIVSAAEIRPAPPLTQEAAGGTARSRLPIVLIAGAAGLLVTGTAVALVGGEDGT